MRPLVALRVLEDGVTAELRVFIVALRAELLTERVEEDGADVSPEEPLPLGLFAVAPSALTIQNENKANIIANFFKDF